MRTWAKWIAAETAIAAALAMTGAMTFAPPIRAQEAGAPPRPHSVEITPNAIKVHIGDKVQ
ncbi:MAG TPA: hypothetical protein VEX69_02370, partial [Candidatus Limnocylindria bacterium]|nr:hypothetical protein [Candidatus Limnocylindria bacterium]